MFWLAAGTEERIVRRYIDDLRKIKKGRRLRTYRGIRLKAKKDSDLGPAV